VRDLRLLPGARVGGAWLSTPASVESAVGGALAGEGAPSSHPLGGARSIGWEQDFGGGGELGGCEVRHHNIARIRHTSNFLLKHFADTRGVRRVVACVEGGQIALCSGVGLEDNVGVGWGDEVVVGIRRMHGCVYGVVIDVATISYMKAVAVGCRRERRENGVS
jgi:hypothetical protein